MSGAHPPLTCKEVKQILKNLGFELRPRKSTSHEQWAKINGSILYKVTVDCPKSPFSQDLISSMAKQAGVSKKEFYAALD
ncbi:type II toxin-antitoxin system HicA family toxin [Nitrosomonas sp. Nm33]|uniref:type II toxin-antitoxin system HicA family toxin n=1 Tax=Nitrosomonas sp. Nm33 TaxID=133724 RepID=UPI00089C7851|nr:type II toxin-antitoxin system HicA family toxin [Nitrosomonas sp. Nm33]SDY40222.1 Predicted RNA binding protein YcfA, dsRBD-like fold, HicA-like mRNA interferase family [Nitrosomonas sp. Nm33]